MRKIAITAKRRVKFATLVIPAPVMLAHSWKHMINWSINNRNMCTMYIHIHLSGLFQTFLSFCVQKNYSARTFLSILR